MNFIKQLKEKDHKPTFGIRELLKYIGPGLLVTIGFIDPGNWASNIASGSVFGYKLLWVVALSTVMLVILQHNAAHLGIVTGDCLAESAMKNIRPWLAKTILGTGIAAAVSTALAEILGGAIALNLLFKIPIKIGSIMVLCLVLWMLFTNSYNKLEKFIVGFVSIIGISFIYELSVVKVDWNSAIVGMVNINFPTGSIPLIMALIGAVVMPHNLFLHSEIIQSRKWNLEDDAIKELQLKYEFADTLFSMVIGWAINSAIIILAASTFFVSKIEVTELIQAQKLLAPIAGAGAAIIFSITLLFSGIASTITAGMAGGSIFAGLFGEPYDIKDSHTKLGVAGILITATLIIFFIKDTFQGLIISQIILSIQLPITVFLQIYLTSSKKVMGKYKNSIKDKMLLIIIAIILTILNIMLFISVF